MKDIEFWFSIGSTYSYLSVARLPALERNTGVTFSWYPFSVRKIMQEMDLSLIHISEPTRPY